MEPSSSPSRVLVALGILTAPEFLSKRDVLRVSWVHAANAPHMPLAVQFVVRAGGASLSMRTVLDVEQSLHNDLLILSGVAWNETRLKGPVLSLAAWIAHVASSPAYAHTPLIGKLDDDAYIHPPAIEALARILVQQAPHEKVRSPPWLSRAWLLVSHPANLSLLSWEDCVNRPRHLTDI